MLRDVWPVFLGQQTLTGRHMNRIYRIFSISRRSCLCIRSHWSLNFPKLNPLIVNSFKSEESHGLYRTVGVNNFCLDQGSPPEAQVLTNGPPVNPYSFEVGVGLSSTQSLIVNIIFNGLNGLNGLNFRKRQTSKEQTHWEVDSSASTERKYVFSRICFHSQTSST